MDNLQLLVIVNLLFAGLLGWIMVLTARLARLQAASAALAEAVGAMPLEWKREVGAGAGPRITIEILNIIELARKESWAAGAVGTLTPGLLRRIVYARALKMVQQELLKHHVKAEIRVDERA